MTTTNNTNEVKVIYADAVTSGYGHKKITVELEFKGETKKFTGITNFMPGFDAADELEGQERYEALADLIDIDDQIAEWAFSI